MWPAAGGREVSPKDGAERYYLCVLKALASVAVIVTVLAVIVELSVAGARREERRLLEEFTTATRRQVRASAEVLSARLDALDQDTRVLTDLVERSRQTREPGHALEHRGSETTFRALAVVVPHYRTISLHRADGAIEILAVDPTETRPTVDALIPHTQHLAREVANRRVKALGEPARYGARSFLLYGTPINDGGAIVVASDAAMFLAAGSWPSLPAAQLFVTDPGGVVWTGCATAGGCRATDSDTVTKYFEATAPSAAQVASRRRGDPGRRARRRGAGLGAGRTPDRKVGRHLGRFIARDHGERGPPAVAGRVLRVRRGDRGRGRGSHHPAPAAARARARRRAALRPGGGGGARSGKSARARREADHRRCPVDRDGARDRQPAGGDSRVGPSRCCARWRPARAPRI